MKRCFSLFLIAFFLVACTQQTAVPSAGPTQSNSGYPPPFSAGTAYPGASTGNAIPTSTGIPTPTADPNMGAVTGVLTVKGQGTDGILSLAGLIRDKNDKEIVAGINTAKAPQAVPDVNGKFMFVNVPPGRYAIVFDNTQQAFLLLQPNGTEAITLTVEAGKTIDLGVLDYPELPAK